MGVDAGITVLKLQIYDVRNVYCTELARGCVQGREFAIIINQLYTEFLKSWEY